MRVKLLQLDGKFPNLALMRIGAHHRERGDEVELRHVGNFAALEHGIFERAPDRVYASLLFSRSRPLAERLKSICPDAIVGGSGWDAIPNARDGLITVAQRRAEATVSKVEQYGITTRAKDWSLYPNFPHSVGFTQRGCRMGCGFCDVPVREGKIAADETIAEIWRGDPWPKNLILWDNDTFGHKNWKQAFTAIRDGGFKVSFNQGVNCRLMNEEQAEWLAAMPCYDDQFKKRQWYTAWDNKGDEEILFRGLGHLVKYGVNPDNILVYMLVGYWPGETEEDRLYRHRKLRAFGCRPYPMPYVKTPELVGFARWIVPAYDKRVSWDEWKRANYDPRRLHLEPSQQLSLLAQ